MLRASLCLATVAIAMTAGAQSAATETAPAAGSAAILNVVRWNGSLPEAAGRTVEVRFALFQDQAGGLALWNETQTIRVGADGKYSVLLGASSAEGLPQALFGAGEARWIEARVAGAGGDDAARTPGARSLLAAVPYALKSVDSETLAGRAAADYVTREDLRSAVAASVQTAVQVHPETTPTGSGTTGYVPLWTGTSTLGNSVIAESGTKVGVGTATPATTLDVNGASTLRGSVTIPAPAVATVGAGVNSSQFSLNGSAFVLGGAAENQRFGWETAVNGNNTASPSALLEILYASGTNGFGSTSLTFSPVGNIYTKGTMTLGSPAATAGAGVASPDFLMQASSFNSSTTHSVPQSFAFSAVPAGNNTASPTANLELLFSAGGTPAATGLSFSHTGIIAFAPGQTFPVSGFITGITTTSPLTGSGTSGSVALGLNTSALETTLNSKYAQLSAGNIFTSYVEAYQTSGPGNAAVLGWGSNGSVGTFGDSDSGYGVQGESSTGFGVYSQVTSPAAGSAGVLGFTGSKFSSSYSSEAGIANAGVWADNSGSGSGVPVSLFATGDDVYGGAIVTNGADYPALFVDNNGGTAIQGEASSGYGVSASTSSGTGIYGSTSGGGDGVEGFSSSLAAKEAGVLGVGNTSSTTYGALDVYSGVWGDTGTSSTTVSPAWAIGVLGTADDSHAGVFLNNSSGWSTMYVSNGSSGGTGLFKTLMAVDKDGACGIGSGGSLSCTGQLKSLVTAGGGARKVETYAVQSPENWMEDFGSGDLVRGVAVVKIDPAFAETVSETADYHVFLTPRGDSKGLYAIHATATGFEVRESAGGTSSLEFDYRIVAKRRGYEAQRLTDVTERFNAESAAAAVPRSSGTPRPHRPTPQSPLLRRPGALGTPRVAPAMHPVAQKSLSIKGGSTGRP